jgi:hypothetical protein
LFIQHKYDKFERYRCWFIFGDTFTHNNGQYDDEKDIHWTTSYKIAGSQVGEEISTLHDDKVTVWAAV